MSFDLTLAEEFYVLSSDPKVSKWYNLKLNGFEKVYTIASSMMELYVRGKISFDQKMMIKVQDATPTGVPYLDELHSKMIDSKERKLKDWLHYFYMFSGLGKKIHEQLVEELVRKNAIKEEDSTMLFLIPTKRYVHLEAINKQIIERLRAEVLEDGKIADHTIMLITLLDGSSILKEYFSSYEEEQLEERLEKLEEENPEVWKVAKTLKTVINEIWAIITVAVT